MDVLSRSFALKPALLGLAFAAAVNAYSHADIAISFDEGAPKDRFTFKNVGTCTITESELILDLSGSKSGLIFDVTGAGAGVEVFQPLEIVQGADALSSIPEVKDGDNLLAMRIVSLKPGAAIAFTIDVDDTMGGREITVADSEINGALVMHKQGEQISSVEITSDATATMTLAGC